MRARPLRFDRSEAIRLYQSGRSLREVGTALGVSGVSILKALEEAGIERRAPVVVKYAYKADEDLFVREKTGSMSRAAMARQLGRSERSVLARQVRLGLHVGKVQ